MSAVVAAAVVPAAAPAAEQRAGVQPATAAQQQDDEVVIVDSDNEDQNAQRAASGRSAGPSSRPAAAAAVAQQGRRRPRPPQAGGSGAAGGSCGSQDIIDLTSDSPPSQDDIQIVRSTVVPRQPTRGAKRPRTLPSPAAAAPGGLPAALAGLSPTKQRLLAQLYNPPPPPPPDPEPEGPKCGICMEAMGGSQGRPMASGPCGHVYCHDCLLEAVRAQKKCPTCRKNLQTATL
ncbi:hypothetical protein ABPG75_005229 [Micractinium tetrahymenae]